MLAREQATGERAPHEHAQALVDRNRQQFVLSFTRFQRVMNLLADETLAVLTLAHAERLHQVPCGIVGAAEVTYLAIANERVERFQGLLQRRQAIPLVNLV